MRTVFYLLALLVTSVHAQQIYLRHGLPVGGLKITGVSNGAPVVVTFENPHGLSVGDFWTVSNEPGSISGTFKIKAVPSAQTIALATVDGADVAGNGGWFLADRVPVNGRSVPVTLNPQPQGLLDGPGGPTTERTRCAVDLTYSCLLSISVVGGTATANVRPGYTAELAPGVSKIGVWRAGALNGTYTIASKTATSFTFQTGSAPAGTYADVGTTVSKTAYSGSPHWELMQATHNSWIDWTVPGNENDRGFTRAISAALIWYVSGEPVALEKATYARLRPEDLAAGSTYCDDGIKRCSLGDRGNSLDYGRFGVVQSALATLMTWDQLTTAERSDYLNKLFNRKEDGCAIPELFTGTGSISANGSARISGEGVSALALDDTVMLGLIGDERKSRRVVGLIGPNEVETNYPFEAGTYRWQYAHRAAVSECGLIEYLGHHPANPLTYAGRYGSFLYNTPGTFAYEAQTQNLYLSHAWAMFRVGMMFAPFDQRARNLAERAFCFLYDYPIGFARARWAGYCQAGSAYGFYRSPWMVAEVLWTVYTATTGYPAGLVGSWLQDFLKANSFGAVPNSTGPDDRYGILFGEGAFVPVASSMSQLGIFPRLFAGTIDEQYWRRWYGRQSGSRDAKWLGNDSGRWGWLGLIGDNPNASESDPPVTSHVFINSGQAACAGSGMKYCTSEPSASFSWAATRTGFSMAGSDWLVTMFGGATSADHDAIQAGDWRAVAGPGGAQPALIGDDSRTSVVADTASVEGMSTLKVGTRSIYYGNPSETSSYIDLSRVDPGNRYVFWRVNLAGGISPRPIRANRWFARIMEPGEPGIVVIIDDVASEAPVPIVSFTHYGQNGQDGEGNTTCLGGCSTSQIASGRIVTRSLANTIVSQWYFPSSGTVRVDALNGSYEGGRGYTFRVTAGPSAPSRVMEAVSAHKLIRGTGTTAMSASQIVTPQWMGVDADIGTFVVPRGGVFPSNGPSFLKASAGPVLVAGLAPGLYSVVAPIGAQCASVMVDSSRVLYCGFVPAGKIDIVRLAGGSAPVQPGGTTLGVIRPGRVNANAADSELQPLGQTWEQQAYIKASKVALHDLFGKAVAVWDRTLVVGAPNPGAAGSAYVFQRNGNGWAEQARLEAVKPGTGDLFGSSVATAADTIVVGSPQAGGAGRAYVFAQRRGLWSRQADLGSMISGWSFGRAVAVADDTIVATAINRDGRGVAYVFTRVGETWREQAQLTAGADGEDFGRSVSVAGDTIVVGAPLASGGPSANRKASGASYVFSHKENGWEQSARLSAPRGEAAGFGTSVSLSGDTIIVGATGESGASGAAYVFRLRDEWELEASLKPSEGLGALFGYSVALSGDVAVITSIAEDDGGDLASGLGGNILPNAGAAYVFARNNEKWTQTARLKASNRDADDLFGLSAGVSGGVVALGAVHEASRHGGVNGDQTDNSVSGAGATYVFTGPY